MDATTIAELALALNVVVVIGGGIWAVANIKADFAKQISKEREDTTTQFDNLRATFFKEQKIQDANFGEVNAAVRQYIVNVEKEMHQIEIWGRDHFVQQKDFERAMDLVRSDIKTLGTDIKSDMKELAQKIEDQIA